MALACEGAKDVFNGVIDGSGVAAYWFKIFIDECEETRGGFIAEGGDFFVDESAVEEIL